MGVSDDRMEKALTYLATTDEEYGKVKAACEGLKYRLKIARSQAYLEQREGTVAEREAKAETDQGYRMLVDDYEEQCTTRDTIGAKRETERLVIEVWRSTNANRRQANV